MNTRYINYQRLLNEKLLLIFNENVNISFELFPPKNNFLEKNLWASVKHLSRLKPNFFSVTYGANNSQRSDSTFKLVKSIKEKTGIDAVPHLTCIGIEKDQLINTAQNYWKDGIKHIIALRGDSIVKDVKNDMYALDLVLLLKKIANFEISVAAYPEVHPEATDAQSDLMNLKKKVEAGATRAITQFFFDIEKYLYFRDRCVDNNINIDIVPGILPIFNFKQVCLFAADTNVCIPNWLAYQFRNLEHNIDMQKFIGVSIAIELIKILYREGVRNFHFYTLNRSDMIYALCHILGKS